MEPWAAEEISRLTAIYGTVPPPWGIYPEFHPYSAFWRMGGGEGHVEVWSVWWNQEERTHAQALAYFRS